jgi:hypothetical protein
MTALRTCPLVLGACQAVAPDIRQRDGAAAGKCHLCGRPPSASRRLRRTLRPTQPTAVVAGITRRASCLPARRATRVPYQRVNHGTGRWTTNRGPVNHGRTWTDSGWRVMAVGRAHALQSSEAKRPLLSPARAGNGAGRGCFVVVRGCPLGTAQDRCEWHACGTVGEDDPRTPWRRWLRLDRRVRPVLGDHCSVGKSPEGSRQLGPVRFEL